MPDACASRTHLRSARRQTRTLLLRRRQRLLLDRGGEVAIARLLEHAEADGARDSALLAEPHRWPVLTPIAIDDQKVVRQHVL